MDRAEYMEYMREHGKFIYATDDKGDAGWIEIVNYHGEVLCRYLIRKATRAEYEAQIPDLDGSLFLHFFEVSSD